MKKFILGFIAGGAICATVTVFAVEYAVTANPFPVKVNGTETTIEGYNINDNTYFKLRDVADAVGGFEVGFSDNTITIDTGNVVKPEPTQTTNPDLLPLPEVSVKTVDGVEYVDKIDIEAMLDNIGLSNYEFSTTMFYDKTRHDGVVLLENIPHNEDDDLLIPLSYYTSTIIPVINTLR